MSQKLTVWIFQTGEPLPVDEGNSRPMRAQNLTNFLINNGHKVVLWSSDYYHQKKTHRFGENKNIKVSENLEVRLIYSRGYKRNIGFGRLLDHFQLAVNLKQSLKTEKHIPDVAFIGYPPIEPAAVLTKWLKKNSVPVMLDIKDQWPTLFIEALPHSLKKLGLLIFSPYFYLAKRTIEDSTEISTMSNGFVNWVQEFHGRSENKTYNVFPLTSPINNLSELEKENAEKWWDSKDIKLDNHTNICFVGSLSQAFDFDPIKKAAKIAYKEGNKIKFIICGTGDCSNKIQDMFSSLPNVLFPGWINRAQIEVLSDRCIASIAPYKNVDNFVANIPNKVIDSMSLKLPILSPLEGEVKNLISKYKVGLIYDEKSGAELFSLISNLSTNPELQKSLSENAANLYKEFFSYDIVYKNLVNRLEDMAN